MDDEDYTFPGAAPNDSLTECLTDYDGDDYGAEFPGSGSRADIGTDCDDDIATTHPAAAVLEDLDGDGLTYADGDTTDELAYCTSDADGDGYGDDGPALGDAGTDCDDGDTGFYPGAPDDVGDGYDQSCDGIDGTDADGDGEASQASLGDDCDDADATVNTSATDAPGDGFDEDCSGYLTCYEDSDGDGYGTTTTGEDSNSPSASGGEADTGESCDDAANNWSDNTQDCYDSDGTIYPGAAEVAGDDWDDDCSGYVACFIDGDADDYGSTDTGEPDSSDTYASSYTASAGQATYVGACGSVSGDGWSDNTDDCNDDDALTNPDGTDEPGDTEDEDCDGLLTCYDDSDGDGYGTTTYDVGASSPSATDGFADTGESCNDPGNKWSDNTEDCDDSDGAINPGETEGPGDLDDEDCSGKLTCYVDADGDGYGADTGYTEDASSPVAADGVADVGESCDDPSSYWADNSEDCYDLDSGISPDGTEVAGNDWDEDCSSYVACYEDGDRDGYGSSTVSPSVFDAINGYVVSSTCGGNDADLYDDSSDDCDDGDNSINPSATDNPGDTIDDDCSGYLTCYRDQDRDSYGSSSYAEAPNTSASGGVGSTCDVSLFSSNSEDCADGEPYTYPGAASLESNPTLCYRDQDDDGYGDASASGLVDAGTDCADDEDYTFPGAAESESSTACMRDEDEDGYGADTGLDSGIEPGTDCRDDRDDANPSVVWDWRTEDTGGDTGDAVDNNCDGSDWQDVLGSLTALDVPRAGSSAVDSLVSLSRPGDLDGDGYDDLAYGAWEVTGGSTESGVVYLLLSDAGTVSGATSMQTSTKLLNGFVPYGETGASLTIVSDVHSDGYDDLVVGAPGAPYGDRNGYVYFIKGRSNFLASSGIAGRAWATLSGDNNGDELGYTVASGDLNGDGIDEVLLSAPFYDGSSMTDSGAVYLFEHTTLATLSGSMDVSSASPDATLKGVDDGGYFGLTLAVGGDLDGDGYGDVLIGAPYADNLEEDTGSGTTTTYSAAGKVYVVEGNGNVSSIGLASGTYYTSKYDDVHIGASLAIVGAADGNVDRTGCAAGCDDFVIGADGVDTSTASTDDGTCYLMRGEKLTSSVVDLSAFGAAEATLVGSTGDQMCSSVVALGDVDADGFDEFAIGSAGFDQPGTTSGIKDHGIVYLLQGDEDVMGTSLDFGFARIIGSNKFGAGESIGSTGSYYSDLPGLQVGGNQSDNYLYLWSSGD